MRELHSALFSLLSALSLQPGECGIAAASGGAVYGLRRGLSQGRVIHSLQVKDYHQDGNNQFMIIVLLMPAFLCHKDSAQGIQSPNWLHLLPPVYFFGI